MSRIRDADLSREGNPERVERADIELAQKFLERRLKRELVEKDTSVSLHLIKLVADHSERVRFFVRYIARNDDLDVAMLEMGAVLHDVMKLASNYVGGVNGIDHASRGYAVAHNFVHNNLNKADLLAVHVGRMVAHHSYSPYVIEHYDKMKGEELAKPESDHEWALRDANLLDYVDIWGIYTLVEMRQRQASPFYKEDQGKFHAAFASAVRTQNASLSAIRGETAKKLAVPLNRRAERFIHEVVANKIGNLADFRKFFEDFIASETERVKTLPPRQ